jgi:hypothetical protein
MTDRAVAASLRRRRSLSITVQYVQRCQNRCFCRPRDVARAARRSTILHSSARERPLHRLKIRLANIPAPSTTTDGPPFLRPSIGIEQEEGADRKVEEEGRWVVLEACRLDPDRPLSAGYERLSARKVSRTDPDATPMTMADRRIALGYQDHYLIDGGKARIILHALLTPDDVMENQVTVDQVRRVVFRYHVHPQRLIADSRYGTVEIIRMLEENGIRAYVPLHDWEHKTAYFGPSKFTFDTTRDIYVCPQGESLQRSLVEAKAEQIEYRADPACCNVCPLKEQCTPSDRGRSAPSIDRSTRTTSIGSVLTTRRLHTGRPCRNVAFGSSRSSQRRNNGTGSHSSGFAALQK